MYVFLKAKKLTPEKIVCNNRFWQGKKEYKKGKMMCKIHIEMGRKIGWNKLVVKCNEENGRYSHKKKTI